MKPATSIILASVFVALITWDIIAYLASGTGATISIIIRDWGSQFMTISFLAGFVCGHVLWPLPPKRLPKPDLSRTLERIK